jgi:MFS family permease
LKSVAVTYVLSGGIFAAVLGPTLAKYSSQMLLVQYTGCFVIMGILGVLNWLTLSQVTFPKPSDEDTFDQSKIAIQEGRKLVDIVSQPLFILSCSIATIAHTVMVMIMSNCALSMSDEYSLGEASIVLEMHFLAMFAPGFVTGMLIKSYGPFKMSLVGTAIFALSSIIFALGTSLWNYYVGMILLGIAWNFSYSSATIMLTGCYQVTTLAFTL